MNEVLQKAFEEQMNREFYSAYLYLNLSVGLDDLDLEGMSNWMRVQAQEELAHATHLLDYLMERCDGVRLLPIKAPQLNSRSALKAFELTLSHEQVITGHINDLAGLCQRENDHAAYQFIQWYVNEQVEEESTAKRLFGKLKMIGDNTAMLFAMDAELGTRTFVDLFPPV